MCSRLDRARMVLPWCNLTDCTLTFLAHVMWNSSMFHLRTQTFAGILSLARLSWQKWAETNALALLCKMQCMSFFHCQDFQFALWDRFILRQMNSNLAPRPQGQAFPAHPLTLCMPCLTRQSLISFLNCATYLVTTFFMP